MDIVRAMIERIEAHAGEEPGKPGVTLVGALAQILAFTQRNNTATSNGSYGTVLMVAGARKHLCRTVTSWRKRAR